MNAKRLQLCIGFHSVGSCMTQFAVSLAGAVRYEGTKISSMIHIPSPYVTEARNKIVKRFLTQTKATHLLMMDVDLEFPEDAISATLRDMHAVKADILFGNYSLGDWRPSIFGPPPPGSQLPSVSTNLDGGQIYDIYAGSTGWLLATREALEKIGKANADKHWPWFDHDVEIAGGLESELRLDEAGTIRIGEDFSFSKRAREAGIKIHGTTSPLLIHLKTQPLLNHFQEQLAIDRGLKVNNLDENKEKKDEAELDKGPRIRLDAQECDLGGGEASEAGSGQGSGEREKGNGEDGQV